MVTSKSPRTIETALAMGFAVVDTIARPSGYVPGEFGHHEQWGWPHPYRIYAELLGRSGGPAMGAESHRRIWTSVVEAVPDGAAALVIAHGGRIEPGLVAAYVSDADHKFWGAPLGHCDRVHLGFGEGRFVSIRFSRVPSGVAERECQSKQAVSAGHSVGHSATHHRAPPVRTSWTANLT